MSKHLQIVPTPPGYVQGASEKAYHSQLRERVDRERTSAIADRFRSLLIDLVRRGVKDLSGTTVGGMRVGMMIGPFLPAVFPLIEKMPDATAIAILEQVEDQIAAIRGEE